MHALICSMASLRVWLLPVTPCSSTAALSLEMLRTPCRGEHAAILECGTLDQVDAICMMRRKERQEAQAEMGQAEASMQGLEASLREVRGRLHQKKAELDAQASQGAVVKTLMAAKASGQIPGIYGRLGKLQLSHCHALNR